MEDATTNSNDTSEKTPAHLDAELQVSFPDIFPLLLQDHTTDKNIIWATDEYREFGSNYSFASEITVSNIVGQQGRIIIPRLQKELALQANRVRDMAEVFTPTWVCNAQNNLIDEAWFGSPEVFNREYTDEAGNHLWQPSPDPIPFAEEPSPDSTRSWQDYVKDTRLEITCGEAPYLVSRYDRVTGTPIQDLHRRIGLLDRKLRVVSENAPTLEEWQFWALEALKATYGYEWQGDSLLLARENVFLTLLDYCQALFGQLPSTETLQEMALVISWNLWQMDGLKMVVPKTCRASTQQGLFGFHSSIPCPGCANDTPFDHTGIQCRVRDWSQPPDKQEIPFVSLLGHWS